MKIIKTLFGESMDFEKLEQERLNNHSNVLKKWEKWLKENKENALKQRISLKILNLKNKKEPTLIKLNKKTISEIVSWSGSRHNEFKKAKVIEFIMSEIKESNKNDITEGYEYRSGCFSEGAHGRGKNKFGAKFANGGNYRVYSILGSPYLLANGELFCFESFEYNEILFDQELENKYIEFEKEIAEFEILF